jgi:regulatory protein
MPTITAIKPQKNKRRVNIYLDGKFGFGLDMENFVKLGLKVEQILTEQEVEDIVKKSEFQKSLDKLLRFATFRPRSEKEVKDYFRRKEIHDSLTSKLFERLIRMGLIDDQKFAWWWVEQRQAFKPKSKRILQYELRIKGINKEIIETILSEVKIDEIKIAKDLLKKKKFRWEKLPKLEAKRKMSEFLARKGFGWEEIKRSIEDY